MTDPTRFVLVQTSHAGNVGAAARAIKVTVAAPARAMVATTPTRPAIRNAGSSRKAKTGAWMNHPGVR